MNYIILDLEWDSAYHTRYKRFLNQILQIGAVKLDESFHIIDTFEATVKSDFSKRVTGRFSALTGITTQKMLAGIPLDNAVDRYNEWSGSNTVTMTWSNSDLFSIIENEEFLLTGGRKLRIEKYLDLQKYIQGEMRLMGNELTNQISLEMAAGIMGISTESFDLHTARDDSLVCAEILKKCYNSERFAAMVQDTANPDFYRRLTFKPYAISDIHDSDIEPEQLHFICEKCSHKAKRLTQWKYRNRWFYAEFLCKICNHRFCGRVSFKKTYDSIIVRHKITPTKPKTEKNKHELQSVPEKL